MTIEIHYDNSKFVISKSFIERFEREATDLLELIKTMNIDYYGKYDTIQVLIDSFSKIKE